MFIHLIYESYMVLCLVGWLVGLLVLLTFLVVQWAVSGQICKV